MVRGDILEFDTFSVLGVKVLIELSAMNHGYCVAWQTEDENQGAIKIVYKKKDAIDIYCRLWSRFNFV